MFVELDGMVVVGFGSASPLPPLNTVLYVYVLYNVLGQVGITTTSW